MAMTRRHVLSLAPTAAAVMAFPRLGLADAAVPRVISEIDKKFRTNVLLMGMHSGAYGMWFESVLGPLATLSVGFSGRVRWIRAKPSDEMKIRMCVRGLFPQVRYLRFLSRKLLTVENFKVAQRPLEFDRQPRLSYGLLDDTVTTEMFTRGNALLAQFDPVMEACGFEQPARLQFESYDDGILTLSAMNPIGATGCYQRGIDTMIMERQRQFPRVSQVRLLSRNVFPFVEQRAFEQTRDA